MKKEIQDLLKNIPKLPWVYQFFDESWKIIYIWKSVKLHSRVNSYFNWTWKLNFAKKKMVDQICDIQTVVTNTAIESLLLETNLIKKHKPKYNILMKDDKNHTYLKITDEIFPKVVKSRIKTKSWIYFWPYISTNYVNNIIKITKKIFWHRSCNIVFENQKNWLTSIKSANWAKIPCIDYYIKRCSWPCLLKHENMQNYDENIEKIKDFLSWNFENIIKEMSEKMKIYASNLEFEKAKETKENIESIAILKQNQIITWLAWNDFDVINYLEKYESFYISKIEIRDSKITWIYNYEIIDKFWEKFESIKYFIENNYLENKTNLNLILPEEIELEEEILKELNLKIQLPKIWEKNDILTLAYKNAFEFAYKKHLESLSVKWFTKKDMSDLLAILSYKQINKDLIFECNDISHISWNHTVASRSIIENWKTNPSKYKKFKIKTLLSWEINDFDSMREIMTRRLAEIKKTNYIPDLIIIDGWKWQLSSVMEIINFEKSKLNSIQEITLEDQNYLDLLNNLQLVSLAKKEEELFLPWESESIIIDKESNILRMIQKIRDEAHRFAITFNRDSRIKASKKNILEELPWIWPKTRAKLLKHYWSVSDIIFDDELKNILSKSQIETLQNHWII